MKESTVNIRSGSPEGDRAAERLRARLRAAEASARRVQKELAETIRRVSPHLSAVHRIAAGLTGSGRSPAGGILAGLDAAKLEPVRLAIDGIGTALGRAVPRLRGFGVLLRQIMTDAARLGSRTLMRSFNAAGGGAGGGGWLPGLLRSEGGRGGSGSGGFGAWRSSLTNPWMAAIGGAVAGGILLSRLFRNRTEKKLRETIQSTYGVTVKDMAVLKQIKELGEQTFGRGQVSKHLLETIKLDGAKQLIQSYAESTGQTARGLVTEAQLRDPSFAGNRFIRREFGGPVLAGVPYLVGERRPELFIPDRNGTIIPSVPAGGQPAQGGGQGGGVPPMMLAGLLGVLSRFAALLEEWESKDPAEVVTTGAKKAAVALANAMADGMERNGPARKRFANKVGA